MEKLNGLKTILGLLILIPAIAEYVSPEEAEQIINTIVIVVGGVMTLIGLAHKLIKKFKQ